MFPSKAINRRQPPTPAEQTDIYIRVVGALMLRDMRTRFTGTYWGYLFQVLWPVSHTLIIAGAMALQKVPSPLGDSTMLFAATGAVPALAFQYISREIMKGILTNKPLIYYPQVKTLDVVFSRIAVETVSSFIGTCIVMMILFSLGIDPIPTDIFISLGGYLCAIALGIGVGTINVAIVSVFPGWSIGYILVTIGLYITSGIIFVPSSMPEQVYYYLKFNPILQIVEWVRLGYDPGAPITIDYTYLFLWVTGTLITGLLLERTYSRKMGS